jgi:hypothetical protein
MQLFLMTFCFFSTLTAHSPSSWRLPLDLYSARRTLPKPPWPNTLRNVKPFTELPSLRPPPHPARSHSATTRWPITQTFA